MTDTSQSRDDNSVENQSLAREFGCDMVVFGTFIFSVVVLILPTFLLFCSKGYLFSRRQPSTTSSLPPSPPSSIPSTKSQISVPFILLRESDSSSRKSLEETLRSTFSGYNNAEDIVFIDDDVNINQDKSPLINNTLATGTTHDETNDEDEDDIDLHLVPLHDIIDHTGQRETEDSDCHLDSLFNVNIGAGGGVEISELKGIDTDSRFVNLLGFSHRWTELDPKDRRRTILLLRDAIEWLLVNVFPRIRHLLPDESCDIVSHDSIVDNDNEEEIQRLWFVHKYIVVCCLFNRIIKCVPWVYIEPLDLLKKSVMSGPQLRIIHQIRSWLIHRACKSRWVKKECFIDDSGNTISVWVIPLLYILMSHCTGGAHSVLQSCFRLAAPGVAECNVLKRNRYFVNPLTACVYTNVFYNQIPYKLQDTHVVQLKQCQKKAGDRWHIQFRLNEPPRDTGDGDLHSYRTQKESALSRVVQCCTFPSACPLGTMDHLDAHQHNGIQNVENCQKPENLDRIGSAILVHPSNVSFSSSEAVQP